MQICSPIFDKRYKSLLRMIIHQNGSLKSPSSKTSWSQSVSCHRPTLTTWDLFLHSTMEWRDERSHPSTKCPRYVGLRASLQSQATSASLILITAVLFSPCWQTVEKLLDLLATLDQWINETPPVDQPSRFGNKAFRTWYGKLDQVCALEITTRSN